jgi:hypothetical protein
MQGDVSPLVSDSKIKKPLPPRNPRLAPKWIRPIFCVVSTVQEIESAIAKLSDEELAEVRSLLWDQDIERDAAGGRLEDLAAEAVQEHRAGKTKRL